ncbi:hypothetical protein LTR91_026280 [Friedmanniomyces endolithicus]|uniref:Uncharacterized protein n=1 Tax=Friedmanniomyces endolithicus TaxID=329885 RepID=A0A4U0UVQ5_9PEZI|nr:hypothetical protein LTS09_010242 [Friedmanniomyces endolithicus]KAK0810292.1 hypothetical protein LTR59_002285 [Friedmanniomyces endolithicus]KAK0812041.1 hypothetical protein LTR38_003476 [Friedmanniomyces endolithicus]KAK0819524.1 hypothetical protein LTR75_002046 [Friedmanniomyces endolithicus]KAK0854979.1 hypothetical protein LTR03_002087 [Friedmanniomyces endolithicus]
MAVLTWPPPSNGNPPPSTAQPPPAIPADPTNPIDPSRFAAALEELPLDTLHSKAAEIRNSITRLRESNEQMMPFADEGDAECREAMFENLQVIGRMNGRLGLLKAEVERRGMVWMRDPEDLREEPGEESAAHMNGTTATNGVTNRTNGQHVVENNAISGQVAAPRAPSGRLTDEELRQQLAAQLDGDEDDDGVHL